MAKSNEKTSAGKASKASRKPKEEDFEIPTDSRRGRGRGRGYDPRVEGLRFALDDEGRGFGPGAPMGGRRGGPGRHGRPDGRGRRQRRGDVRAALLLLIAEQPRHGYELMQAVAERTGGQWQPSPGSIYPALSALQDEGYIKLEADESNRGVAHLTEAGEKYLAEHGEEFDSVWDSVRSGGDVRNLFHAMRGIGIAARQVGTVGTPEQIAAALELLTKTQRELYAILATDPSEFTAAKPAASTNPSEENED